MKKSLLLSSILMSLCGIINAQLIMELKEINTDPGGSSYPYNFTVAGDKLFFEAFDPINYSKLWVSDGTTAGTELLGPAGGATNSVYDLEAYQNKLYFSFNDNINGQELWISDGTVAGTKLFKDINSGSSGSYPEAFTICNNQLFFTATNVNGEHKLYVSDGTAAGTVPLANKSAILLNGVDSFAVMNNDIYFTSDNGTGAGYGFWKSDGTTAGTVLLKPDFNAGTFPGNYAVLNNKLYFNGSDFIYGSELWVTDGTPAGTKILKNINTNDGVGMQSNGSPFNMQVFNGKIYFTADDGIHGGELWVTDGTDAGTVMVKDIVPGSTGSIPSRGTVYNGALYVTLYQTSELWKTDGTETGTVFITTILPYSFITAVWNNKMYLSKSFDNLAWQSDGTAAGTKAVVVENSTQPVYISGTDQYLTIYKNELYFSGACYYIAGAHEPLKLTTGTLPLHLISFSGEVNNNLDILTWKTSGETNTAYFSIEQSIDGITFKAIGKITAKSNNAEETYTYSRQSLPNITSYYRLQIFDKDGSSTYSPAVKLKHESRSGVTAAYNAAFKQIIITNNTQSNCKWQLVSMGGSFISKGNSSDALINVPAQNLAKGSYILVCTTPDGTEKIKFVIF